MVVTRCFRYPEFSHQRRSCKGEDRFSLCYKCGETGHLAKSCTGTQKCFLCVKEDPSVDCGHVAGSGACAVFRRWLEAEKKKKRWKLPKRKYENGVTERAHRPRPPEVVLLRFRGGASPGDGR